MPHIGTSGGQALFSGFGCVRVRTHPFREDDGPVVDKVKRVEVIWGNETPSTSGRVKAMVGGMVVAAVIRSRKRAVLLEKQQSLEHDELVRWGQLQ